MYPNPLESIDTRSNLARSGVLVERLAQVVHGWVSSDPFVHRLVDLGLGVHFVLR